MSDRNICKFVVSPSSDWLNAVNFVYETDLNNMRAGRGAGPHCMLLTVQGTGSIRIGEETVGLAPGVLVFLFEGEAASVFPEKDLEYMYISFRGSCAEELFRRFGISRYFRLFRGFEGLIPVWKTALSRTREANIDLAAMSMILYAFSLFEGRDSAGNKVIRQVMDLTEKKFTDPELSVGSIAGMLGYNSKYLSHLFRTHVGISYSGYLRNRRMEYAVFLFEHGLDSVKNVATLSGFRDPLYFSRVFSKSEGISPKQYIQNITNRQKSETQLPE